MISSIVLSSIIVQTAIALYLFNSFKPEDGFEKKLNAILVMLVVHLGTKFFILTILKNSFLYHNNATGFGLSYGPLLFIIARLYVQRPLSQRAVLLHLLPFTIFTLAYFVIGAGYVLKLIPGSFVMSYAPWYQWLATLSLCIYPGVTCKLLYGYKAKHDHKVKLLQSMAYIMVGGVLLGTFTACIHFVQTGHIVDFDLRLIPYICLAVLPVLILRYKFKIVADKSMAQAVHNIIVISDDKQAEQSEQPERQYKKSALDTQMMDEYEHTLVTFMQKTRIYLETEISLEGLSAKVNIPKHHLTQLLNERFKKNFYAFINEYRIGEAIEKLKDPDTDDSILSLAYDCGFNSKSSFNNYFKKLTGVTPSMYRKEHVMKVELTS